MATENRIEWVDVAKGIGILLVIAGHAFRLDKMSPIYAFHLPLFFFLSGMFAMSAYRISFADYTKKIAKRLLVPWIVMLLISGLVCLMIPSWRNQLTLSNILRDLYSANTNVFQNSSLWFLPCMFFALEMFRGLDIVSRQRTVVKIGFLCLLAVALMLVLPHVKILPLPGGRIPFKIDTAALACLFVASAAWLRGTIDYIFRRFSRWILIIFVLLITIVAGYCNGWTNMNSLDFGYHRALYLPISYLGIIVISLLSDKISTTQALNGVKFFFLFYGRNSLIIFGFQSLFLRLYLLVANKLFGLDMHLYAANPVEHQVLSFGLIAFIISPIVVWAWKFLKEHGKLI